MPANEAYERALKEASLRLAWYLDKYGAIPDADMLKLQLGGHAIQSGTEIRQLLADANTIRELLLELGSHGSPR